MIATQASLAALAAHTQKRRDSVDTRALKALQVIRREKAPITLSGVARRAGVTPQSPLSPTDKTVPDDPTPSAGNHHPQSDTPHKGLQI